MARRRDRRTKPLSPWLKWGRWGGLMGLNLALLGISIWLAAGYVAPWLGPGNAGAIWLLVGVLGLTTLAVGGQLLRLGADANPRELAQKFLMIWGLGLGVVVAMGVGFPLVIVLIMVPTLLGQPWLLLPWLAVLLPTPILAGIDLCQGKYARTLANFGWLMVQYLFYFVVTNGLILTFVGLALALFPVGLVVQFISGVELIARWLAGTATDSLPLLCTWADRIPVLPLSPRHCGPILVGFHLGHPLGMFLAARYFETYLTWGAEGYRRGMEWIRDRITPRS